MVRVFNPHQKKNLDVGVPETLAHTECCALFKSFLVLRDLLISELGHHFKAGLDLLDGLGLEATGGHCLCPDRVSDLGPDKDGAPSIGAADGTGGDVSEVGNIVKADMAAGLLVLVGHLERKLDDLSALGVDPELALADLHLLDGLKSWRMLWYGKFSMQKIPTASAILAPTSRAPTG